MNNTDKKAPTKGQLKLIGIGLIVLVLLILFVAIPAYRKSVRNKAAVEIRTAMESLRKSIDNTWKSSGSISGINLDQALTQAGINSNLQDKWQFAVAWKDTELYTTEMVGKLKDVNVNQMVYISPYKIIIAVAKEKAPVSEGTKIWFEGDSNSYHGFGVDEQVEPDWRTVFPNP